MQVLNFVCSFQVMLHAKYSGKFLKKLKKYAAAIAPAAKEIMRQQWDNRTECKIPPEAKDIYGDHCFGAVDVNKSFLIELIFRPANVNGTQRCTTANTSPAL